MIYVCVANARRPELPRGDADVSNEWTCAKAANPILCARFVDNDQIEGMEADGVPAAADHVHAHLAVEGGWCLRREGIRPRKDRDGRVSSLLDVSASPVFRRCVSKRAAAAHVAPAAPCPAPRGHVAGAPAHTLAECLWVWSIKAAPHRRNALLNCIEALCYTLSQRVIVDDETNTRRWHALTWRRNKRNGVTRNNFSLAATKIAQDQLVRRLRQVDR
jgi:hypothetical protein